MRAIFTILILVVLASCSTHRKAATTTAEDIERTESLRGNVTSVTEILVKADSVTLELEGDTLRKLPDGTIEVIKPKLHAKVNAPNVAKTEQEHADTVSEVAESSSLRESIATERTQSTGIHLALPLIIFAAVVIFFKLRDR